MRIDDLYEYGIPKEVIDILKKEGLETLYPPQEEAVKRGSLELKNSFVVSVPTASGKTLIAELLMIRSILELGGKCLYIVPLRALASEKLEEFKKYEVLGVKVAISTGDYDSADAWLRDYDVIIATSEKADSLLRHRSPWLKDVKVLVADEIHLINDGHRGPTLEVTIAKMRQLNPGMIVLGLSATIKNAEEIASWLRAELIRSDWRPVKLREGVFHDGEIFYGDSKSEDVEAISDNAALDLALDTIKEGGQGLIFVNTRRSAEKLASDAAGETKELFGKAVKNVLAEIAEEAYGTLAEPTKICRRLSECLKGGSAFHHAGLEPKQRRIVEKAFRGNLIKVLVATPTLAAGVNLPARRVIVRDYARYDANLGRVPISVMEYKQFAGRAGRPKYDKIGEAVLVAKGQNEKYELLENYVLAEPEEIHSKLAVESALRTHVLAAIAMGYADSIEGLMSFFGRTFFAHQESPEELRGYLMQISNFLVREGFCSARDEYLVATRFGRRVSELYIDPLSAVVLRDAVKRAQEKLVEDIAYLHSIARTSELGGLYLRQKDYEWCTLAAYEYKDGLLVDMPHEHGLYHDFEGFLSELKMAMFLKDWMEERSEEFILEKYNLGPGDVRSKVERAEWLLYSMSEIARLMRVPRGEITKLHERMRYGVREELLELVSLKGIGRARARSLHASGFKDLASLRKADVAKISGVRLIGRKIAESIKSQLTSGEVAE